MRYLEHRRRLASSSQVSLWLPTQPGYTRLIMPGMLAMRQADVYISALSAVAWVRSW